MLNDKSAQRSADDFIEKMGRYFEEEGVPRIAGRLFGLLMVSQTPCSLDDVSERLQVSKGSASTNARLLEQWGVAERVTEPGDRRDFYVLAPDMPVRMLERQVAQIQRFTTRLVAGRDSLEAAPPVIRERFDSVIALQHALREMVEAAIARQTTQLAP